MPAQPYPAPYCSQKPCPRPSLLTCGCVRNRVCDFDPNLLLVTTGNKQFLVRVHPAFELTVAIVDVGRGPRHARGFVGKSEHWSALWVHGSEPTVVQSVIHRSTRQEDALGLELLTQFPDRRTMLHVHFDPEPRAHTCGNLGRSSAARKAAINSRTFEQRSVALDGAEAHVVVAGEPAEVVVGLDGSGNAGSPRYQGSPAEFWVLGPHFEISATERNHEARFKCINLCVMTHVSPCSESDGWGQIQIFTHKGFSCRIPKFFWTYCTSDTTTHHQTGEKGEGIRKKDEEQKEALTCFF